MKSFSARIADLRKIGYGLASAALEETFASRKFMKELGKVRVNWLQTDPTKAANALVRFVAGLKDAPARK